MLRIIFSFMILLTLQLPALAQECKISDTKDELFFDNDVITELSLYYKMSKSEYNKRKKSGAIGGRYKVIKGTASYNEMRETIVHHATNLGVNNFTDASTHYVSRKIKNNGLESYRLCLENKTSIVYRVIHMQSEFVVVKFRFSADEDCNRRSKFKVTGRLNIANIREIESHFKGKNACDNIDFTFNIRPLSTSGGGYLILGTSGKKRTLYFPPLSGVIINPIGKINRFVNKANKDCGDELGDRKFILSGSNLTLGLIATTISKPKAAAFILSGNFANQTFDENFTLDTKTSKIIKFKNNRTLRINISDVRSCSVQYSIGYTE